jgi:hypothetical protein
VVDQIEGEFAEEVANFQWPRRNTQAVLQSLEVHADLVSVGEAPPAGAVSAATQQLLAQLPDCALRGDASFDDLVDKVVDALAGIRNPKANPGYPWCIEYTRADEVLQNDVVLLVCCAVTRLIELRDDELTLPLLVRVFIKNEPHSQQKIEEGRRRNIKNFSLDYLLVQLVLYGQLSEVLLEQFPKPGWFNCPGMGFIDEHFMFVDAKVRNLSRGGQPVSTDVKAWEYSVSSGGGFLTAFDLVSQIHMLARRGGVWKGILERIHRMEAKPLLLAPDGTVFMFMLVNNLVWSGRFMTAHGNTLMRRFLACVVQRACGGRGDAIAMGDDCVETLVDRRRQLECYARFGFAIKAFNPSPGAFEFCSHLYENGVGKFLNIAKLVFRMVHREFNVSEFMCDANLLRHNPVEERRMVFAYLSRAGWFPDQAAGTAREILEI